MTVDLSRPSGAMDDRPLTPPVPDVESNPPVLNETIALLRGIHDQLEQAHSLGELPTRGMFNLQPDATSTPDGRIMIAAHKTRIERLVIIYNGVNTFTVRVADGDYLNLPATVVGFGVIDMPFAYVLERGQALQITRTGEADFTAYAIGYTE